MTMLATDAVVLHAADYLESSRILRLLTREAGVLSVLARGARSSRKRFSAAVGLFAEGQAQLQIKPGRDLHTLVSFDVARAHAGLALDLRRFGAASAMAEVVLRLMHDEASPAAYAAVVNGLERLAVADAALVGSTALCALWQVVALVGFRPALDHCAECLAAVDPLESARFHPLAGGTLCERCARQNPGGRLLPADARETVRRWMDGEAPATEERATRAHQRLLREFLEQHIPDPRPLRAYESWEAAYLM